MMQLFCPACENVVWVEAGEPHDTICCPECKIMISLLGRRKARPVTGVSHPDAHMIAGPEPRKKSRVLPPEIDLAQEPDEGTLPRAESWEEQPDQDFSVPVGDPPTRYVALPYRPEGGVNFWRLPAFVATLLLLGLPSAVWRASLDRASTLFCSTRCCWAWAWRA
jgi:hypothetical protein